MKTRNTLIVASGILSVLLTTGLAQADQITASFQRDMNRLPTMNSESTLTREYDLPIQKAVNRVIRDRDSIRESFDRNLNHESIKGEHIRVSNSESDYVQILVREAILR